MWRTCFASLLRPVRGGEVGGNRIGTTTGGANFRRYSLGLLGGADVMNDDLRSGLGKGERAGAPNAARGAGRQRCLS